MKTFEFLNAAKVHQKLRFSDFQYRKSSFDAILSSRNTWKCEHTALGFFRCDNMNPKNILVTGANRGIGLGFVKQLLTLQPRHLFATCRSPDSATELKELQSSHSNLHILKYDVSNPADHVLVAQEVSKVVEESGLNLLINNAGILSRLAKLDQGDCFFHIKFSEVRWKACLSR